MGKKNLIDNWCNMLERDENMIKEEKLNVFKEDPEWERQVGKLIRLVKISCIKKVRSEQRKT